MKNIVGIIYGDVPLLTSERGKPLYCPECGYEEPEYGLEFGCYTQHNTYWECPRCSKRYEVKEIQNDEGDEE